MSAIPSILRPSRLDRTLSVLAIALTIAGGWWAMRVLASAFRQSPLPVSQAAPPQPVEAPSLFDIMARSDQGSFWSFGDSPWKIGRTILATDELERALKNAATSTSDAIADPAENELISLLDRSGMPCQTIDGRSIYSMSADGSRLQMVVDRRASPERIHGVTFAAAAGADTWEVWQLARMAAGLNKPPNHEGQHLLPLPGQARQIAGRWSIDNELLLEVVTLGDGIPRQELLDAWSRYGWQATPLGQLFDRGFQVLCQQNDVRITAWSPDEGPLRGLILSRYKEPRRLNDARGNSMKVNNE